MANMTLRDVPGDLHRWLKKLAEAHRRSVNQEVIALLEGARNGTATAPRRKADAATILEIGRRCAALPDIDTRSAEEILGYDRDGIPS